MKLATLAILASAICSAATVNICSTAACNGTTDDTAAVQAAINGSSSGDIIVWSGITKFTSQVTILTGRTYQGTGGVIGSINNQLFLCNNCSNVTISGLTFTGGGVHFTGTGSNNLVSGITVQNINTATDYTMVGVLQGVGMNSTTTTGSTFTNIHDTRAPFSSVCAAIWYFDGNNSAVTNNTFNNTCQPLHYTAAINPDVNLMITGNTLRGTSRYGLEVQGCCVNGQIINGNYYDTPLAGQNGQAFISSAAGGPCPPCNQMENNVGWGPNQGNPMNQSDFVEAMGAGFTISGNTGGHWGEAQLIGLSDNTWKTINNTWCDMNYPTGGPSIIVLEAGGMNPGTNTGNTYSSSCLTPPVPPNPPVAPSITSVSPLPPATLGAAYSYQFLASGTTPINWSGASLPSWASLSSSGALTGTPSSVGVSNFTVTANNTAGSVGPVPFSLTTSTNLTCAPLTGLTPPNVNDIQWQTAQTLSAVSCINNLKMSGQCNIIDIQRVIIAALNGACKIGP